MLLPPVASGRGIMIAMPRIEPAVVYCSFLWFVALGQIAEKYLVI